MKCEKCGADIIDTAKFCPSCGYKIKKKTNANAGMFQMWWTYGN